jgi:PGF-pre-PGF domain-containing protein
MNYKKMFIGLLVVVVLAAMVLAVAHTLNHMTLLGGSVNPATGQNVSGSINLSAQVLDNQSVANVYFMWQLTSNHSVMANVSTTNRSGFPIANFGLTGNETHFNTTFDTTSLPDGIYNLTLLIYNGSSFEGTATNVNNQSILVNESASITVTVDNTVPAVTINNPAASGVTYSLSSYNVTFNVSVSDLTIQTVANTAASGLVIFEFDNATGNGFYSIGFNSSGYGTGTPVNQSGYWSMSVNVSALHAGTNTVTVHANDTAGNSNRTQTWTFEVNTPHNVTWFEDATTLISGQNFSAINTTVYFNVSVKNATSLSPITAVIFMFDNASGNAFNVSNGSNVFAGQYWNASYNVSALAEGTHTITMFVNDTFGNINKTESISFVVDKTGPSISVTCTSDPNPGDTVTCSCSATDALTDVLIAAKFAGGSTSESTTAGSVGTYTSSTCLATDRVGNQGTGTGSFTVVAASSGSSGSGGSSGGSNTKAAGQFSKEVWSSINAGEKATVEVTNGEIGVTEVSFAVKDTTYGAWVKVEKVSNLPSSVKSYSKKTYKNIKITENNVKKALKGNVEIDFKVTKAWLSEQKLSKNNVAMFRYVDGKWTELKTTVGTDDGTYQHYTAETPGFSYFVIGQKEEAAPLTEEEIVAEEVVAEVAGEAGEVEVTGEAAEESQTWPWVVLILVVIAGIVVAYWLKNRK